MENKQEATKPKPCSVHVPGCMGVGGLGLGFVCIVCQEEAKVNCFAIPCPPLEGDSFDVNAALLKPEAADGVHELNKSCPLSNPECTAFDSDLEDVRFEHSKDEAARVALNDTARPSRSRALTDIHFGCSLSQRVNVELSGPSVPAFAIMLRTLLQSIRGGNAAFENMDPDERHACKCLAQDMLARLTCE